MSGTFAYIEILLFVSVLPLMGCAALIPFHCLRSSMRKMELFQFLGIWWFMGFIWGRNWRRFLHKHFLSLANIVGCGRWSGGTPNPGLPTCLIFFFFLIILFIYLFLAVLGLRFCARAFSSCCERGPLFIAVHGPLTVTASLVVEHRLQTRKLSSCGTRA